MNNRKTLIAALLLLLGTACQKDHTPRQIELLLEPMGSTAKLAIDGSDGTTATWSSGDAIRFNGTVATVIRETNGHTYVDNSATDEVNRALFPTTLASSGPAADLVTVSLPASYDYATDGAQQKLALPMAARATGNDPLPFMHLTGALCFTLQNSRDVDLTLDSIVVVSSGYLLNGSRQVDLAHLDTTGAVPTANAARRKVTMTFERQSLVVPAGESRTVVLPVAPVGDTNHFTVAVTCHHQGVRYTFRKRQTSGGPLRRNQIGYVAVALDNEMLMNSIFEGGGTLVTPYLIRNVHEFLNLSQATHEKWKSHMNTSYGIYHYRLTSDLVFDHDTIFPIHYYHGGTFDGDGHSLTGLVIQSANGCCALFDTIIEGGNIKNLTLQNFKLCHSGNMTNLYLGGFCAFSTNGTTFSGCHIDGISYSVTGTFSNLYVGGIAAHATRNITLTNCIVGSSATLNSTANYLYYGNLLGHCSDGTSSNETVSLTSCTATNSSLSVNTTGALYFGGLIGYSTKEKNLIDGCIFTSDGTLTSTNTNPELNAIVFGGLIGRYVKSGNSSVSATNTSVQGTISTSTSAGTSYHGAYVGMQNGSCSFDATCSKSITCNGSPLTNNCGN